MKKVFVTILIAAAAVASVLSSCQKNPEGEEGVKKYNLTVKLAVADSLLFEDLGDKSLTLSYSKGADSKDVPIDTAGVILKLPQGTYSLSVSGKLSPSVSLSGAASVELYQDAEASIELTQIMASPLIFRAIYSCCGIKGYTRDNFFEIVNNSDEVQYLDGVCLGCYSGANYTSASAWLPLVQKGLYPGDVGGAIIAFPGSGKEHPLEPGQAIVLANDATDHSTKAPAGNNCPDLSGADWEVYIGSDLKSNTKDTDYADVPNMEVIHFVSNDVWCQSIQNGGAFMFRMPEGVDVKKFAADSTNLMITPGTQAQTYYVMIPSEYVLDAVSLRNTAKDESTLFPFFASWDEVAMVPQATQNSGNGVRRRVVKVENGRAYYQDTNNSKKDFISNVKIVPGAEYTEVDPEPEA
ncbi:MAG: DUF4876 domain-containing protein [Bacteroidales bacterium]|nr:DUF4876 domain-containing protein [Bacteroidales bacterium]